MYEFYHPKILINSSHHLPATIHLFSPNFSEYLLFLKEVLRKNLNNL